MIFRTVKEGTGTCEPKIKIVKGCCESESDAEGIEPILGNYCGTGFERRYRSKEEKVQGLEAYLKELDAEATAVREAIADIKSA